MRIFLLILLHIYAAIGYAASPFLAIIFLPKEIWKLWLTNTRVYKFIKEEINHATKDENRIEKP